MYFIHTHTYKYMLSFCVRVAGFCLRVVILLSFAQRDPNVQELLRVRCVVVLSLDYFYKYYN